MSQETSDSDQCSVKTQISADKVENHYDVLEPTGEDSATQHQSSASRPNFLDLKGATSDNREQAQHFRFDCESADGESSSTGPFIDSCSDSNIDEIGRGLAGLSSDEQDISLPSEPLSMPPLLNIDTHPVLTAPTTSNAFSYKNPVYQSANPSCGLTDSGTKSKVSHSSDHDIPGYFIICQPESTNVESSIFLPIKMS